MASKDVFICHASEDKERYVMPLTSLLHQHGIDCWLDEEELRVGEHLDQSINQALNSARYGLVVFSKAFFAKEWANRELQMIREREQEENRVILLPILEDIAESTILEQYGFLRNRRFLKWSDQDKLITDLQHYLQGVESPSRGVSFGHFLYQLNKLNAVMHWVARPVPAADAQAYFRALQVFFYAHSPFLESVNDQLCHAIDNLCRVLGHAPDMSDGYGTGKLAASIKYCEFFLNNSEVGRKTGTDLIEAIFACEVALEQRSDLKHEDRSVLIIYLMLMRYLKAYDHRKGYHKLHHEVGTQLYELLAHTVPGVMAAELPSRHDEAEWGDIYLYTQQDWLAEKSGSEN